MNQTTTYVYDGDGNVTLVTAFNSDGSQQQTRYVYGVNTSNGNLSADTDLLREVDCPDPANGAAGSASDNQAEFYAYDALGETTGYADRIGTTHAYKYDSLGRMVSDGVSNAPNSAITTRLHAHLRLRRRRPPEDGRERRGQQRVPELGHPDLRRVRQPPG